MWAEFDFHKIWQGIVVVAHVDGLGFDLNDYFHTDVRMCVDHMQTVFTHARL